MKPKNSGSVGDHRLQMWWSSAALPGSTPGSTGQTAGTMHVVRHTTMVMRERVADAADAVKRQNLAHVSLACRGIPHDRGIQLGGRLVRHAAQDRSTPTTPTQNQEHQHQLRSPQPPTRRRLLRPVPPPPRPAHQHRHPPLIMGRSRMLPLKLMRDIIEKIYEGPTHYDCSMWDMPMMTSTI